MPHRNDGLGTWANKIGRAAVGLGKKIHLWPWRQAKRQVIEGQKEVLFLSS